MSKKMRIGILFGGKSTEHEVSLRSAKNIISALNKKKYESVLIGINKEGRWLMGAQSQKLLTSAALGKVNTSQTLAVIPGKSGRFLAPTRPRHELRSIDVIFPVLHGPLGEDGTIQGMLKLLDVPYVGAGVLGSALGMDKDAMKRLLRDASIPITKFLVFRHHKKINFEKIARTLKLPLFIKPANAGSSVGISKVRLKKDFRLAVKKAFEYDSKILIEAFVPGREIEVSVLGNERPKASLPGEIIPTHEFYSYEAKYIDEDGARLDIPAKLSKSKIKEFQKLAIIAFKVLELEGMARIDFFLTQRGKIILNEVNTIPGFTNISMYPKLWEASGIPQSELLDQLISLAIERHKKQKRIQASF